jgi:hypothetical protein
MSYRRTYNDWFRETSVGSPTAIMGAMPPRLWASFRSERQAIRSPPMPAATLPIRVNRAPALTLWATVVAERPGYPSETARTLGRFVAGSSARTKARRVGISDENQDAEERHARAAITTKLPLGVDIFSANNILTVESIHC